MKKTLSIILCGVIAIGFVACGSKQAAVVTSTMVPTTHKGHEYVDLGLPSGTLWATCNIGANNPEEYGNYFAWGETKPKGNYDWSTYKYCKGSMNTQTKYCISPGLGPQYDYGYNGFIDHKLILEATDDAATTNWGGNWRMPTVNEIAELYEKCRWKWTDDYNGTGVAGYIVKSKAIGNKNSIFLPAAGFCSGTNMRNTGERAFYWSSTLNLTGLNGAYVIKFNSNQYDCNSTMRRDAGRSVRPVCSPQP